MALETEIETYSRELPRLLAQEGRFVLVHGQQVAGIYDTFQDALAAGYETFGLEPFMVKQIEAVEQVQTFTRDLPECRT